MERVNFVLDYKHNTYKKRKERKSKRDICSRQTFSVSFFSVKSQISESFYCFDVDKGICLMYQNICL